MRKIPPQGRSCPRGGQQQQDQLLRYSVRDHTSAEDERGCAFADMHLEAMKSRRKRRSLFLTPLANHPSSTRSNFPAAPPHSRVLVCAPHSVLTPANTCPLSSVGKEIRVSTGVMAKQREEEGLRRLEQSFTFWPHPKRERVQSGSHSPIPPSCTLQSCPTIFHASPPPPPPPPPPPLPPPLPSASCRELIPHAEVVLAQNPDCSRYDDSIWEDSKCEDSICKDSRCEDLICKDSRCEDTKCEDSRCEDSKCEDSICKDSRYEDYRYEDSRCEHSRCEDSNCKDSRCEDSICKDSRCEDSICKHSRYEDSKCEDSICKDSRYEDYRYEDSRCEHSRCEDSKCEESRCEDSICKDSRCEDFICKDSRCEDCEDSKC
ncbi:unnamed protein product [Pleuronectes platessa]|uniref:Uncharacterized protein n=1 Tax=Pleuronectes platessa TaxID=8262 RepID=A0A9N7Z952_PLEPL|nr:unnamed protein product [Pleuronectes platessa]